MYTSSQSGALVIASFRRLVRTRLFWYAGALICLILAILASARADAELRIQHFTVTLATVNVVPAGGISGGTGRGSSPRTYLIFFGDSHTYTFDQSTFDPPFTQDSIQPGDRVTLWYVQPAIGDVIVVAIEDESLPAASRVQYTTPEYRDPQRTQAVFGVIAVILAILALLLAAAGAFSPRSRKSHPELPSELPATPSSPSAPKPKRHPSHHPHRTH